MVSVTTPAQRRRFIIAMALRRARPGSGSPVEFLRARTWSDPPIAFDLRMLRTPYVLVGGLATAMYMPQRPTLDADILVTSNDAARTAEELRAAGCAEIRPLAFGGHSWRTPDGSILDVIESDEPWAVEAVGSPNISPTGLPVIALPYLVLMKLDASRTRDIGDLSLMLGGADMETRDRVRDVIRRFRPAEIDDIESLIALGDLEFQDS